MTTTEPAIGSIRSHGPSVQDLHAAETRVVPPALLDHSYVAQGMADVPKTRYTSAQYAALENEYMWTQTWQMACTVDEVLEPGDHVVYDVADQSVIVTRTKSGELKAYYNSCLHRGTKLRVDDGRVASFRCPFHGWKWDLDCNLIELPAEWDFRTSGSSQTRACRKRKLPLGVDLSLSILIPLQSHLKKSHTR
jgi:nitrite reductase/ring-hydroxylating ferredoxin subunit